MSIREVYFDNNATTPLHPEVKEAIKEFLAMFGNASSQHRFGRKAREAVESARAKVAQLLGAEPSEIIFTSCATESNNLVLKGIITCACPTCKPIDLRQGRHIITSQVEHPSVLSTCQCLEKLGYNVTYLPVDKYGMVDLNVLEQSITQNTVLISVMTGNNEVGTLQPIKEISEVAVKHGVPFHTDAVQAVGKVPMNVQELSLDYLSLSGHKIYGPKGIGALYVRKGRHLCPLIHGGHQEQSLRAGTENTVGIVGLGKAIEVAAKEMETQSRRVAALRDKLEQGILNRVEDVKTNGHPTKRLPGTLNVSFRYVEGESILYRLDALGIAVSTGSACSSGSLEPSHVLLAMGLTHELAHGSIRFSLGRDNTEDDVSYVLEKLPGVIQGLRDISPLYARVTS